MSRHDGPRGQLPAIAAVCLAWLPAAITAAPTPPPKVDATEARITRLIEQLGDKRAPARDAAAGELEKIGDKAVKALTRTMSKHKDTDVRDRARRVLGRIKALRINAFIEQLCADEFQQRVDAEEELEKIGRPAVEALEKASRSTDFEMRLRARRLLSAIKSK